MEPIQVVHLVPSSGSTGFAGAQEEIGRTGQGGPVQVLAFDGAAQSVVQPQSIESARAREESEQSEPRVSARPLEGATRIVQSAPSGPGHILKESEQQPAWSEEPRSFEHIALKMHILRQFHKTTIIERHIACVAGDSLKVSSELLGLCGELLEFAIYLPASRVVVLNTICALAVADPCVCKAFKDSEEVRRRLQDPKRNLTSVENGQQIGEWASVALDAIVNKEVHDYWTNVITGPVLKEDLEMLRENSPATVDIDVAKPENPECWSPSNLYFAIAKKLAIDGPSENEVLGIYRMLQGGNDASRSQILFQKLVKFASHPHTAIAVMKRVIVLIVQEPFLRKALEHDDTHERLKKIVKNLENPKEEELLWGSIMLYAFEHESLHKCWSEQVAASFDANFSEQSSCPRFDSDNSPDLWLARKLSDKLQESTTKAQGPLELANLYVELATMLNVLDRVSEDKPSQDRDRRDPFEGLSQVSLPCDQPGCGDRHLQYEMTSKELVKYVLDSAPAGSLVNVTSQLPMFESQETKIGQGGFATVYRTSVEIKGKAIAIKLLQLDYHETLACKKESVVKIFARELRVLARLDHPNVMKLLGYALHEDLHYYFASEYMDKGDLKSYMSSSEGTTRNLFIMSLGIAKGICYLHSDGIKVVHGDLKTPNVLVTSSGEPVLADFGLARMAESLVSKGYYSTVVSRASERWIAYEYYHLGDSTPIFRPTRESDVWAFGMTLLETLTKELPYAHIMNAGSVATAIIKGDLPKEPTFNLDVTDATDIELKKDIWLLCNKCWARDPGSRPSMEKVEEYLILLKYRYGIMM